METLEAFLRAELDAATYAAFFGSLLLLGLLELVIKRSEAAPRRRRRWPLNYGVTAINILVLGAIPVSGVYVADYARENGYGLLNLVEIAPLAALVLGLLFRSWLSWAIHLAMHKIPLLWRIHRVHHTDPFLDVSTTVRFHPFEFLISTPVVLAGVLAMGVSPVTLLIYELLDAVMAVFTHANIRLPGRTDRILRSLLVTPDMHRVHHSTWQPETDSNYGATLSIWDRLFGTYRVKTEETLGSMEIGLAECQDERPLSWWWVLSLPFRESRLAKGGEAGAAGLEAAGGNAGQQ